ncbi:MAG: hypothetical protein J6L03_05240 [Bacteroidaceae bacterium]|nr:hypothetical protein [Bacteroidaceae bacterium]
MKKISFLALAACAMLGFTSCEKNDTPDSVEGKNLWGDVLRGDDMQLQFYPDHFAFYWEYTFDAVANPEIGLIIEGEFPNARFLSYNVYDDDEQTSFCTQNYSLMDVEIEPDNGYINTFREETTATNQKYTVYVLPTDAPESIVAGKENVCWFDADVEKVCTMLRYYIPVGGVNGGVDMPSIKAIDLTTGQEVNAPERVLSGLRGEMELPSAAFTPSPTALFFRAPFSYAYPNGPSEYCYSRNVLETDEVIVFNFKAPSYPSSVSEFETADMRYWSVCVGNEETYTPLAISDYQTKIDANGFANYILADKNSADYAEVKRVAEEKGYNILEWDGEAWRKGVMILYRNMVFDEDYAHSMRLLDPVGGPDVDVMSNPAKYIAVLGLGEWGATGAKVSTTQFIAAGGNIPFRQPLQ